MKDFAKKSLYEKVQEKKKRLEWQEFWRKFRRRWHESGKKILIIGASIVMLGGAGFIFWVLKDIPKAEEIRNLVFAESSVIYDRTGEVPLYTVHGDENREYVTIDQISSNIISALLAAEDADFYNHPGIDIMGLMRGVYCIVRGQICGGGSTLTMQTARNTLITRERTIIRKIREIYLAFRIEKHFTKDEILELYLNKISFGNNAYGIERAAKTYFNKSAKNLSLAESIVLASLPQAPTRWSPYGQNKEVTLNVTPEFLIENEIDTEEEFLALDTDDFNLYNSGLLGKSIELAPDVAVYLPGRTDYVLNQMVDKGFISDLEYDQTAEELRTIAFTPYREEIKAPHFVLYVRQLLEDQLGKEMVEQGGLKIYTTLDYDLQQTAEELATKNAAANASYGVENIALVSAEPSTGYITAMVGSKDYWSEDIDGKVNVVLQKRQPGSSFKPIAYAASFEKGLAPGTVLFDVATRFGPTTPQNFDGQFMGPLSVRKALGNSRNIPAVKAGIIADTAMYDLAQNMGLQLTRDFDFYGSSLALGTGETRPLDMLQAYSIFAMQGKEIPLTPILWVEDKEGDILLDYRTPPEEPEQVMDERIAYMITDVLSDAEARGPGWNSRLQLRARRNAVKTGTSNAVDPATNVRYPNDAWTIGYTPQLVTVVWAGNNRGYIQNNRASGWQNAALYWKEFMDTALEGQPVELFERPQGLKTIAIDTFSGKLPPENYPEEYITRDIFLSESAPTEVASSLQLVAVEKTSQKLPNEYTPPDCIETRAMIDFHSYRPEFYPLWEVGVRNWVEEKGIEWLQTIDPAARNFLREVPTEETTVHTLERSQNKPQVSILTPVNFGLVTPPYINVFPEITAPNGLKYVEIYWDGELKEKLLQSPWNATINIGAAEHGSTHTLRVKAIDRYCYADESTIEVKIGSDDSPPSITFLFPERGATIDGGVLHTFRVNAIDTRSAVDKVSFTVGGRPIGTARSSPFEVTWSAPNVNASYDLVVTAFDTAGNIAEQQITFSTEQTSTNTNFGILSPRSGQQVSSPVPIQIGITAEQARSFEKLEVYYKPSDSPQKLLQTFTPNDLPETGVFSSLWEASSGDFDLFARLDLSSGGTQTSQRVSITVE